MQGGGRPRRVPVPIDAPNEEVEHIWISIASPAQREPLGIGEHWMPGIRSARFREILTS